MVDESKLLSKVSYAALSEGERGAHFIRATVTRDIRSVEDLHQRIVEYVHAENLNGRSVSLKNINRRFYRKAAAYGTGPKEAVAALLIEGPLVENHRDRMLLKTLATKVYMMDFLTHLIETEPNPNERDFLTNTFIATYI